MVVAPLALFHSEYGAELLRSDYVLLFAIFFLCLFAVRFTLTVRREFEKRALKYELLEINAKACVASGDYKGFIVTIKRYNENSDRYLVELHSGLDALIDFEDLEPVYHELKKEREPLW